MKKTRKNLLGICGLLVVAVTTVYAACLPTPSASAASSVTDTVTVRVVGPAPDVDISGIESGTTVTESEQNLNIAYDTTSNLVVILKHEDKNGVVHEYTLVDQNYDYESGNYPLPLDLQDYGYGKYTITARATGTSDGVYDEDIITFEYIPVTGEVGQNPETGNTYVDLDYEPDNGGDEDNGKPARIEINVYDKDGNKVNPEPIYVDAPTDRVRLPLEEWGIPDGDYDVEITAYGRDGDELYKKYLTGFTYDDSIVIPDTDGDEESEEAAVPDTGGLLGNLNISKADYLITGLIVFAITGIGGVLFITKKDKKAKATRRR